MPFKANDLRGSALTGPNVSLLFLGLVFLLLVFLCQPRAVAQIYVTRSGSGSVAEYDLQTGALLNANFVSGLTAAAMGDVVYYSGSIYVASADYIQQFDATTGASINPTYAKIPDTVFDPAHYERPFSLQFTPTNLFVLFINQNQIGTSGLVIRYPEPSNPSPLDHIIVEAGLLFTSGSTPTIYSFVVTGTYLWTSNTAGQVSMYANAYADPASTQTVESLPFASRLTTDLTNVYGGGGFSGSNQTNIFEVNGLTAQVLNASFITTPASITDLTYANGILYVANGSNIATYDAVTGNLLNPQFITGVSNVVGIAVTPGPHGLGVVLGSAALANGASAVSGTTVVGQPSSLTFTVQSTGTGSLDNLAVTIDGSNAADFTVTQAPAPTVPVASSTTFTVQFLPTGGITGIRSAALHVASDSGPLTNPFNINLSAQALSFNSFTGGDGMSDAAKFLNSALGFDWTQSQPALVTAYYANAYAAGLFTTAQVQSLNVNTPLIQRNPSTGNVTLTLALKNTSNLNQAFSILPFNAAGSTTTVDGQGRQLFSFPAPASTQFFRLEAQ